jgi:hypothetical protein
MAKRDDEKYEGLKEISSTTGKPRFRCGLPFGPEPRPLDFTALKAKPQQLRRTWRDDTLCYFVDSHTEAAAMNRKFFEETQAPGARRLPPREAFALESFYDDPLLHVRPVSEDEDDEAEEGAEDSEPVPKPAKKGKR